MPIWCSALIAFGTKMIKESVKVHGQYQLEIKQKVSVDRRAHEVRYRIETWFFLPAALQVNPDFYSPKYFQQSLKNYVRLRPPTRKLSQLLEPDEMLAELAAFLAATPDKEGLEPYENALKRYALTYKRALRLAVKWMERNAQKRSADAITELLAEIHDVLAAYRALSPLAAAHEAVLASQAFGYCDEFISLVTLHYLRRLVLLDGIPQAAAIHALWQTEMTYCRRHFPESIPSPEGNNEDVLYRWSILRKYISRYLFLEVRRRKGHPLLLHSVYAISAAIAMIFATFVAFFWQGRYGALSNNLFLALVIAYIFKDRIKEIGRERLLSLFREWIPDRRLLIYRGEHLEVGSCHESFRFVHQEKLPPEIRALREQAHWLKLLNDRRAEDVLLYRKEVALHNQPELFERTQYSIVDITRFNVSGFLRQIDHLFEHLPVGDEDDAVIVGERLYHVYMIRRVFFAGQSASELVRLVLNAEGIKRLEMIQPLQFAEAETPQ